MVHRVEFASRARRQFLKLPAATQSRVQTAIEALAHDPRPPGMTKLAGQAEQYRIRVSSYRVVYEIGDEALLVLVLAVAHRSRVYKRGR